MELKEEHICGWGLARAGWAGALQQAWSSCSPELHALCPEPENPGRSVALALRKPPGVSGLTVASPALVSESPGVRAPVGCSLNCPFLPPTF